jgi:hypothetical protein
VSSAIVISLTLVTESSEEAIQATEVLCRAAIGLALDGIGGTVAVGRVDDDEDAERETRT